MPKIPALPPMTAPDAADELPIEDVSVNTTKYITLTKLKEWFQALTGWISPAMLASDAVETVKIKDANVTNAKLATGIDAAKLSNPHKFSAYLGSAQNSANGFAKVLANSEIFDTGSNYDKTTNCRFVAPVAGFYFFNAGIAMSSTATSVWQAILYKNGTGHKTGTLLNTNVGYQQSQVSGFIQLAANDYVELFVYASGVVPFVTGAANTYFDGFLESTT